MQKPFVTAMLCLFLAWPLSAAAQVAPPAVPVPPAASVVLAGFYELDPSHDERLQYEQGRAKAIALLDGAQGLDASLADLARRTSQALAGARLFVAGDAEADRQCAPIRAALFVRQDHPGHIYICADTRWHVLHERGPVTNILAQILIHEGAHLAGSTDECRATALELVVAGNGMGIANYGNFHRYARQCQGGLELRALRRQGMRR